MLTMRSFSLMANWPTESSAGPASMSAESTSLQADLEEATPGVARRSDLCTSRLSFTSSTSDPKIRTSRSTLDSVSSFRRIHEAWNNTSQRKSRGDAAEDGSIQLTDKAPLQPPVDDEIIPATSSGFHGSAESLHDSFGIYRVQSMSLMETAPARLVDTSFTPRNGNVVTEPTNRLGMVHIARQLIKSLEIVTQAMDSCLEHAVAGTLAHAMIITVFENFEFVSSAMAVHQSFVSEHIVPQLLQLQGPMCVPPNLQGLYRRAEMHRARAQAVMHQLWDGKFRKGISRDVLLSVQQAIRRYFDVCVHAAKIEVDDIELAVCQSFSDSTIGTLQENHFITVMGEDTAPRLLGLLFTGVPRSEWNRIGKQMGSVYPGKWLLIWYTHRYHSAMEAPLRRICKETLTSVVISS